MDWIAGCGEALGNGWGGEVGGAEGDGLEKAGGGILPETLRLWVVTGVAIGLDRGGGVPATVCRRVMAGFWGVLDGSDAGVLGPLLPGRGSLTGVAGAGGGGNDQGFFGALFAFCCAASFSCICCCCIFFRSFWDSLALKLPLLSRRFSISRVRLDTLDCEVSPMMSLRSFLPFKVTGEPHGAEPDSGGESTARILCIAIARVSVGGSDSRPSRGEDILSSKKPPSPSDSPSGILAPRAGESG